LNRILTYTVAAALLAAAAAGGTVKRSWAGRDGAATAAASDNPPAMSDIVQDLWPDGQKLWVATTDGLGVTKDKGQTWKTIRRGDGLPSNDVLAVSTHGSDIWASCIRVESVFGAYVLHGKGLAHYDASTGRWAVIGKAQGLPADGKLELAWDVVVDDAGVVWVALWDGGIGKSADNGRTWELIIPKDRQGRDAKHFYSIAKRGDLIWAAGEVTYPNPHHNPEDPNSIAILSNLGVFKSEDNGATWTFYGAPQGMIGFAVIVEIQRTTGGDVVWVGTAPTNPDDPGILGNGVYKSEDGGDLGELQHRRRARVAHHLRPGYGGTVGVGRDLSHDRPAGRRQPDARRRRRVGDV
jgi:hypothetical protein